MTAVLTISAVNPAADTLTITGHGLTTGDNWLAVYAPGGVLPAPLVAATDYAAIRVDANTIKLASSNANAMAGIAIDITTSGTPGSAGLLLLRGLPYRVPRIAAPLFQLFSADSNDTWNALIALWSGLHGPKTLVLPLVASFTSGGGSPGSESQNLSGATSALQIPISLVVGQRILACRADIKDSVTGPTKLQLQVVKAQHGTTTSLGTSSPSAGSGAQQTIALTGLAEVIASGWSYHAYVSFSTGSASSFINQVEIDFDRP